MTTGFWNDKYPEGIPATIDVGQYRSIIDVLEYSTRKFADKPAFSNMGYELSYSRLYELSGQFCSYLQNHTDLSPGDRIAIMLPNVLQFPVAVFGAFYFYTLISVGSDQCHVGLGHAGAPLRRRSD